jgi:REP element-mobilizing transposase RayT
MLHQEMTTVKLSTFHSESSPGNEVLPRAAEQESLVSHARQSYQEVLTVPDTQTPTVHPATNRVKEKTIPLVERGLDTDVVLEPVSPRPYDLSYVCLLIPRFDSHYLVGDIVEHLYRRMQQICVSFGWRLDFVTVRPEYLQWILRVPATTPPSQFMRTIRQQTSHCIFENFPRMKRENLSKDFWAPGYLVIVGTRPHPPEMIREYIRLTRQQQGIPPRRD